MILTPHEARELGEALLDAAEAVETTNQSQTLVKLNELIIALQNKIGHEGYDVVATVIHQV